ncbi:MAG: hypothetical protein ACNS63_05530 [Candidatus Nitrospinota bacterium M3_3B_026]
MKRKRKPGKNKKSAPPARKGKGQPPRGKTAVEEWRPNGYTDSKYMDTPKMSVEERKAAQLAKWRKELGLD